MTQTTCNVSGCENKRDFRIIIDKNQFVVCEDHFYTLLQREVDRGEESFIEFAIINFGEQAAEIAEQFFTGAGEKVKEKIAGSMVTMFTYGILKYPNNILADGGSNIIENCYVTNQRMYLYNNSFPITSRSRWIADRVYGTLFQIPEHILLHQYDRIEGYDSDRPKYENMYNRETVKVYKPNGEMVEAQMYIANPAMFAGHYTPQNMVKTGNFDHVATNNRYAQSGRGGGKSRKNNRKKGGRRK